VPRLLGHSQTTSPTKPVLGAFTVAHNLTVDNAPVNAALVTPVSLEYEILDLSDVEKENAPAVVVARTALDLTASKVGFGRYAPTWTVPADEALGRHMIRWFAVMEEDAAEVEWTEQFDVLASTAGLPTRVLYALVSDVRAEGIAASMSDRRIAEVLARSCDRLDEWTNRFFAPVWKNIRVDGDRNRYIYFHEPIIALEQVVLTDGFTFVEPSAFTVYNRHLTGLLVPDDRETPHIEFRSDLWETRYSGNHYPFPGVNAHPQWAGRSPQSIQVKGVFGYTDPDESPTGSTPSLAKEVVVLLTLREAPKQGPQDAAMRRRAAFIQTMKTREQTVTWGDVQLSSGAASPANANFSGDPYIDGKIAQLCPAVSGAVV
jgi:hypothetical protein